MCKNNSAKIIEEINKLSNEEKTEIFNNYTITNLLSLVNHEDALEEHMKELAYSMLKLSRMMSGLYQVAVSVHELECAISEEMLRDMHTMTAKLEIEAEAWESSCKYREFESGTH